MAEKDEVWITLESGKKIQLDENGYVIKGFSGFMGKHITQIKDHEEKILEPYGKTAKSFDDYLKENNNNRKEAAKQFFKENLQDKYVTATINGQEAYIHFTGKSWQEFRRKIDTDEIKASFLENVPEVLQHYKNSGKLTKERDDFSEFHYFEHIVEKNVNGNTVKAKIKVDVGSRKDSSNENEAYHYKATDITEDTKKAGAIARGYRLPSFEGKEFHKETPPHLSQPAFDKNIPQQGEIVNIDIQILEGKAMDRQNILMDSKSKRSIDRNGFMHVELCSITKESVDPYFGREIPKYEELGLVPDRIYYGWRKGEELEKAAKTFCGLPLMRDHHMDSSENPQREHRVGSVGTDCQWKAPYLAASLTVTDAEAIRKIENGERMELSAAYFFTPVLENGEWNGKPYDFVMTDIQGNHVALVEEGRAGSDVCVADTAENIKNLTDEEKQMSQTEENKIPPAAEDTEKTEDAKTACDAEGTAESPAPQPVNDEDTDAEDFLQSAGIAPSDEAKKAFMAGMRYAAKKAEQSASPVPPAKDEEMKPEPNEPPARPAMDANSIKKQIREEMRAVQTAVRDVRPLVGELDAVAFDSADGVYLKACELMGVQASKNTARDVCRALAGKNIQPAFAMDAAPQGFKSRFEM